jgi:hypothetical protein
MVKFFLRSQIKNATLVGRGECVKSLEFFEYDMMGNQE